MIYIDTNAGNLDKITFYNISKILNRDFKFNRQGILSAFAWMLLKYALEKEFSVGINDIHFSTLEHGKPFVDNIKGIEFNLSHSHNAVAVAVSRKPVGIDVQKIMEFKENLANRVCSETELAILNNSVNKAETLYSMWAMKESYVKFTGEGMISDFKHIPYNSSAKVYKISDDYVMAVCCEQNLEIKSVKTNDYIKGY